MMKTCAQAARTLECAPPRAQPRAEVVLGAPLDRGVELEATVLLTIDPQTGRQRS